MNRRVRYGALVLLAASLLAAATAARAQPIMTLGTASQGGTYNVYGEAVARVLNERARLRVETQQTQGPSQNIVMVDERKLDLGMVTLGVARQAVTGTGAWTKGRRFENIRALFPMYDTPVQCLSLGKSGLTAFRQLEGKAVGVGPKAGTTGTYFPQIFAALGMTAQVRYGTSADMANQLNDGVIDAFCFGAGLPVPAFTELDAAQPVNFFAFADDDLATIRKAMPEFSVAIVPKGLYRQQAADQKTLGLFNFAIAHKDMGDDIAYLVTRTVLENNAALVKAHPAARETVPANAARDAFLPFHPGAARYYRDKGIKLDPGAQPK